MAIEVERLVATIEANVKSYDRAMRKILSDTDRTFGKVEHRGKQLEARLSKLGSGLRIGARFAGPLAAAFSFEGARDLIDTSNRLENALKTAGLEGAELTRIYEALFESAQKNAAPLSSLVDLYSKVSLVQKELGVSSDELVKFTDNVALALRVSGADAQSASGALLQLSQALGGGVVRAEEFNSILEGAPAIAQAAAAGIEEAGGSVAKLRQLVINGELSSKAFFRGMEAGAETLREKVAGSTLTTSQAFTKLGNALIKAAGKFDEATDAGASFARAIATVADVVGEFDVTPMLQALDRLERRLGELGNSEVFQRLVDFFGVDTKKIVPGVGLVSETAFSQGGPSSRASHSRAAPLPETVDVTPSPRPGRTISIYDEGMGVGESDDDKLSRAPTKATDAWKGLRKATVEYTDAQELANQRAEAFGDAAIDAGRALGNALADGKLEAQELLQIVMDLIEQLIRAQAIGGGFNLLGGGGGGALFGGVFLIKVKGARQ